MRIIPVLDLKAGIAVLAKGGDRAHYAPVCSILHEGSDPLELARAYRDRLGLSEVYLADLDAIAGSPPNVGLYEQITALGMTLWVDAGVGAEQGGQALGEYTRSQSPLPAHVRTTMILVAGLETLQGPRVLASLVEQRGPDRVAFSLDLRDGNSLVPTQQIWNTEDPRKIAEVAVKQGINRLIILDLARVGMSSGVGTLPLIAAIHRNHPTIEIIAGGGIAGPDDLRALEDAGASAALVGSALHDGRIGVLSQSARRYDES